MQNLEWRRDLKREMEFEMALAGRARSDGKSLEKVFQPHLADWGTLLSFFGERLWLTVVFFFHSGPSPIEI